MIQAAINKRPMPYVTAMKNDSTLLPNTIAIVFTIFASIVYWSYARTGVFGESPSQWYIYMYALQVITQIFVIIILANERQLISRQTVLNAVNENRKALFRYVNDTSPYSWRWFRQSNKSNRLIQAIHEPHDIDRNKRRMCEAVLSELWYQAVEETLATTPVPSETIIQIWQDELRSWILRAYLIHGRHSHRPRVVRYIGAIVDEIEDRIHSKHRRSNEER